MERSRLPRGQNINLRILALVGDRCHKPTERQQHVSGTVLNSPNYKAPSRAIPRLGGKVRAGAGRRRTPSLGCNSSPRSSQDHFSTALSQGRDKTRLVPIIQSPKWGVQSGTARITRWRLREQGGAASQRAHPAVPLRPPDGCSS